MVIYLAFGQQFPQKRPRWIMDISSRCGIGRWLSLRRFTPNAITSADDLLQCHLTQRELTVKISVPADRSYGDWNICIMINITWCIIKRLLFKFTWEGIYLPPGLLGGRWWTPLPPTVIHPPLYWWTCPDVLFAILNRPGFNFHPIIVGIYPSTDSGTPLESKLLACRSQRIRRA